MKLIKISLIVLFILLIAYQAKTYKSTKSDSGSVPVISSEVEEIQISCQFTKEDLLQGLSAYDEEDGYITENILIGGFSDFMERGISSLEYAVYDKDGSITTFKRKVVFNDYRPPEITLSAPLVFKASNNVYDTPNLSSYLEGSDKLDGDISKHILITCPDLNFSEPGKYTASVSLKNSFGDVVNMNLPIHIIDPGISGYTIELTKPLISVKKGSSVNSKDFIVSVRNEYTGEIIPENKYLLTVNSYVDTSQDGIYEIQFSAISTDKAQSGETWMTVIVGDYGG